MAANTEAQHLVALSLGKIAASRVTRSGINLHKSLLVSSVLYKARTTILMNKYRASLSEYNGTDSESCTDEDEESLQCKEASAPAAEGESLQSDMDSAAVTPTDGQDTGCIDDNENNVEDSDSLERVETVEEEEEDKENVKPCDFSEESPRHRGPMDNHSGSPVSVLGSSLSENIPSSQTQDNESSFDKEFTKCERCTKRRLSSVECDTDNNSNIPVKRLRNDENTTPASPVVLDNNRQISSSNNNSSQTTDSNRDEEVPMEQTQITHLVDSFNTGFGGLLNTTSGGGNNCVSTVSMPQVQTCNSTSDYSIGISPKSQGFSEAFSYCSSQIKESFDALTSPIIALTV